ncbi:MAG: hypothetical protein EOL97_14475 [Spirochaetia bacterium]|nr:hypothetical protein [Spirochaetia bacterium]
MTKNEETIQRLYKLNDSLNSFVNHLRNYIDKNLEFFRNGLADEEDERNNGILAVLLSVAKMINGSNYFKKIDLNGISQNKTIKFKIIKGGIE